jgi:acetyl/propionyl-CoA carboxylase alpha subunit
MTDYEVRIGGVPLDPAEGWELTWLDRERGIARATREDRALTLLVDGNGTDWAVTIRGRRIGVEVRTWRERVMAEAETVSGARGGPVTVKATLPGLIVAVAVNAGDEVEAGATLVTIEAMKMQNEVRAPRAGRVIEVSVASGQTVATGVDLLRLE